MSDLTTIGLYAKDCADMLARWDAGDTIWTVEMGGMGPGYEQGIQVLMIAALRSFVARNVDCTLVGANLPDDVRQANWRTIGAELDADPAFGLEMERVGPSGAMYGAAKSLAWNFYRDDSPEATLDSIPDKGRRIQCSRTFP